MSSGMIFFTGAPEARSLDWDKDVQFVNELDERLLRYAGLSAGDDPAAKADFDDFEAVTPYWRALPLERRHLTTGVSQNVWKEEYQGAQFFASSFIESLLDDVLTTQGEQTSSLHSVEEVLSQFYEQSYGVHQDVSSSQLEAVSQSLSYHYSDKSSSYDASGSYNGDSQLALSNKELPPACPLVNLKDIPNSKYLASINPQTLTVNIVVGIISIPEARAIRTRKGFDVNLVELIVGDETKSGFTINFWLSPETQEQEMTLNDLRSQDVILIRNVALSSFRGRVHGQSLRKNVTKLQLLYRKRLGSKDVGGCYNKADFEKSEKRTALLEKAVLVRNWVQQFVAAPSKNKSVEQNLKEVMPADTPPSQM